MKMKSGERFKLIVTNCCLIVCYLIVSIERVSIATSNVHSVWLDASGSGLPRPDPTGNSNRVLSQRTGLWSVAPQDVITNSASSLQPSIAALDQNDNSNSRDSTKRLDSEPVVTFINDTSELDLATTSDWQNQKRANNNDTNNRHVQFDEDTNQKSFAKSSSSTSSSSSSSLAPSHQPTVSSNLNEQDELISTENYNSTDNFNPTSQSNAVGFEDFTRVIPKTSVDAPPIVVQNNSSSQSPYGIEHTTRTSVDSTDGPFIYYLSDADRWNQQQSHHQQNQQQQHPIINSNNQLDDSSQLSSHNSLPHNRNNNLFSSQTTANQPLGYFLDRRWHPQQSTVESTTATTLGNSRRKLHNSGTQYDLRESHQIQSQMDLSDSDSSQRRRGIEQNRPEQNLIHFVDRFAHQSDFTQPLQLTTPLPHRLVSKHTGQKRPFSVRSSHPYAFQGAGPLSGPLIVRHPQLETDNYYLHPAHTGKIMNNNISRRPPQRDHLQQHQRQTKPHSKRLKSSTSTRNSWLDPQANQRSFIQNYVPSFGGYRPKLKAPAILSNWISPSMAGSQQIENSFYSNLNNSPANFGQRPNWNSANYHYYNYEHPSSGPSSPVINQHKHAKSSHLYSLIQPGGAGSINKNFNQRPTLAPPLNLMNRPHHDLAQASQIRSQHHQQSSGNFIPVVAVSITKTSPLPALHGDHQTGATDQSNSETDYHYQPKAKRRDPYQQQAKVHFDDYGNYASGSSGNAATFGGNHQRVAYQSPVETTTVKSALFGYLPHEAERPLISAMNLFSPLQQQLASDSSHREASLYRPRQQYFDRQQQFSLDQQQQQQQHNLNDWSQMQNGLEEPPTPLGLQLQANSYVQNDIAHPFGSSNSLESAADQRSPLYYLDGTNSASYNQFPKQDLPIVQSHQQLMNALLADSSLRNSHLLAAASELNPLMPVVFASPQQPIASDHSHSHSQDQDSTESVQDQTRHLQQQQQQSNQAEQSRGSSALSNKGNKKRSGDFFASAGQLLLSALPLLLAPTLGLMFASSPNAVARYHGQNSVGGELHGLHSSAIPSSYMSGLNQGIVSNASPAPLLFTPSPPVTTRYSSNESVAGAKKATPMTTMPPRTTMMTTTPEPTHYDSNNIKAHQYRPTLGPIQRLASWTGSTPLPSVATTAPWKNYSIILTTLAPPPFSPNSTDKSRTNSTEDSESTTHNITDTGDFDLTTTHTLVLIQAEDDSHMSTAAHNSSRPKNSTSSEKVTSHYELGGYEGTDFEAHVASLRKSDDNQRVKSSHSQEKIVDRNRYHYTQVHHDNPLDDSLQLQQQQHQIRHAYKPQNNNKTVVKDSEPEEKLFPVSRWPTVHHRRTVSLVTSNGNKTMPDSSDKYNLDLISTQRGMESTKLDFPVEITQTNGTMYDNPMKQVYRRRTKRDLSSTISSNEIMSNSTLKDVKKLVKIVKKRRLKKPKESSGSSTTKSSNIATNNKDPMLSESSSGRTRLVDQEKRDDSNSEPTAHIIATMVAQMNDSDDGIENETDRENKLYRQELAERTLRDQLLRKKIILDNLATSNMYSPSLQETQRHSALRRRRPSLELEEESLDDRDIDRNLSSGGRGRLPNEQPIEIISTKVKLRKELDKQKTRKRHSDNQDEEREANLILADDTRKALAKFGNLLIKDTLQVPYDNKSGEENSEKSKRENNTSRHNIRRRKLASNHRQLEQEEEDQQLNADQNDISATERTFPRTTTYPPNLHDEYMNHQYRRDLQNNTRDHIHLPYNPHNYSLVGSQRYRYPIRDQVNLIPDHGDNIGGGYGPPDDGGRFGLRDERHRDYNGPMNLMEGRYAQPDRYNRSESYSNYSSSSLSSREPSPSPPLPNQDAYSGHYSRPPSRGPPSQQLTRTHYESRGHQYPPVPTNYPHPIQNNNTYPPANHRPIDEYYDIRRDNYSHHYPGEQQKYNKYPADSRYPAASQESESWPPRSNSHHEHRDYQPANYPPPIDRDSPQQQQQQQQVSRSIAGDSTAVNEYLKRVQFSDSDRDKLMASYLTCDGLLNDNDHCLERLSCEFSDPQNLEKANKLDRAVSSILLGHILINTYIPNQFKLRLKSASLYGYTHSGNCSKYNCSKLAKSTGHM